MNKEDPSNRTPRRRQHSNTISGGSPALNITVNPPPFLRRNSEGSAGLSPTLTAPIPIQQPITENKQSTDTYDSETRADIQALLKIPNNTKKSRSRASSITSNLIQEIKENASLQKISPHLMNKIRSKYSSDSEDTNSATLSKITSASNGYTSTTKKNQGFHSLFRSVPEDDALIGDYGCALQKEILLQGRIYVSENYICFNANIFGWVTNLVISFQDIIDIEKKVTAYFIPNAISISTVNAKYFFASFLSRDQAYDLMVDTWRAAKPEALSYGESQSLSSSDELSSDFYSSDGSESEYDSDSLGDDISITADSDDDDKLLPTKENINGVTTAQSKPALLSFPVLDNSNRRRAVSEAIRPTSQADPKINDTVVTVGKTETKVDTSIQSDEKLDCACDVNIEHYPNIVMDQVYPTTIENLYNLLYASDFTKKFLRDVQKTTELTIGEWKSSEEGDKDCREMSYIKPLNSSIGPKSTKCNIIEEVVYKDLQKFVSVLATTYTPDVPSGNAFSCKTRTCLTKHGKDKVRVLVSVQVEFTKSSWLKSTIEKASIDGQQTYYKDLDKTIQNHFKKSSKKTRRHKDNKKHRRRKSKSGRALHRSFSSERDMRANKLDNRLLQFVSRNLSSGFNRLTNNQSTIITYITFACLIFMVIMNIYVAKKMTYVEQQLAELYKIAPTERPYVKNRILENDYDNSLHNPYSHEEENELWEWLSHMDPDKITHLTQNQLESDQSTDLSKESIQNEKLQASLSTKIKLDEHIAELNNMIQKVEINLEQVTKAVNEQREKIKVI